MSENLTIEIKTEVPLSRVVDLLTTGLEGGYSPWLGKLEYLFTPEAEYEDYVKYAQTPFWAGNGQIRFRFDGGNDDEGSFASSKIVTQPVLGEALRLMAERWPSHFADFLDENEDAETGDIFLQLLLLGEVIYG